MVVVVFEGFRVGEYGVVVFHDDGVSFGSVSQTISYWGHSSFPQCSGPCSTSISLIFGLVCQWAIFFAGCQLLACALNGLGPSFVVQLLAKCPGCPHLRHCCSRILLWNSSLPNIKSWSPPSRVQLHGVALILIAIICLSICPVWASLGDGPLLDVFR